MFLLLVCDFMFAINTTIQQKFGLIEFLLFLKNPEKSKTTNVIEKNKKKNKKIRTRFSIIFKPRQEHII